MRWIAIFSLCCLSTCLISCSNNTDSVPGYVEGRYIYAASYASGYLEHLNVQRGQMVKAGQVLYVLNNDPESEELTESIANAASAKETWMDMQLGKRPSEVGSIMSQVRGAKATSDYASWFYRKNQHLIPGKDISISDLHQYQSTAASDKASVTEYQDNLITAKLGSRIHQQLAQMDTYKSALATAKKQKWILSTKTYVAPKAGFINDTFYREGEFISASQPVLSLLVPDQVKIIFYVPEVMLASLRMGDKVSFSCDGCQKMQASIDYLGKEAEYTPPVLFTRESRKNLVFRVEAALPSKVALNYHPGQPVTVSLAKNRGKHK